jgi:hypothetical protein
MPAATSAALLENPIRARKRVRSVTVIPPILDTVRASGFKEGGLGERMAVLNHHDGAAARLDS